MPQNRTPSSLKDPELYEELRAQGDSKQKAARISNAAAKTSRHEVGSKGANAKDYDERSKDELLKRAKELGIEGRSKMTKDELISALRNH